MLRHGVAAFGRGTLLACRLAASSSLHPASALTFFRVREFVAAPTMSHEGAMRPILRGERLETVQCENACDGREPRDDVGRACSP